MNFVFGCLASFRGYPASMKNGAPQGLSRLRDFDDAWAQPRQGVRHRSVRGAAERVRDRFASGPRVVSARTLPLLGAAYPAKYAFFGAELSPAPFVFLTHRGVLVQFMQAGALKNLLFNPTDADGAKRTPFFARLISKFGDRATHYVTGSFEKLETQLVKLGVSPLEIDYVAFDHLHVQDLRPLLGTDDGQIAPRFPNATFLCPRTEWDDLDDLHPLQRAWFVPDAKRGARTHRIAFLDGDYLLGDGLMLLRTPGHTSGNQTLFLNTDQGIWGISENGTCADSWSPLDSKIRGLASTCRRQDLDVILNSNTPERAADQYTSMVLERTIVDRVKRAPAFVQMFPSSEATPHPLAPGVSATLLHRSITVGLVSALRARERDVSRIQPSA
jgi:glyoxylase-like metal-dependent hydrolase (beta-lactamase superfamily II)